MTRSLVLTNPFAVFRPPGLPSAAAAAGAGVPAGGTGSIILAARLTGCSRSRARVALRIKARPAAQSVHKAVEHL